MSNVLRTCKDVKGGRSRVFVLGCGIVGQEIVVDLLFSQYISEVVVGDVDLERARRFVSGLKDERVSAVEVDVKDSRRLAEVMKGFDVVANATWTELNLYVTKAAIDAGVSYVDMGGLYTFTLKQMELDGLAKQAGITAVLGCGMAAGVTNILAMHGSKSMDVVDEIHFRQARVQLTNKDVFALAITSRTPLVEYTAKPVVYRDGKYVEVEPFSGHEAVKLSEPFGEVEYFYAIHAELATIPKFIGKGVRLVDFKLSFPAPLVNAFKTLISLGFANTQPVNVQGVEVQPREFLLARLDSLPKKKVEWATLTRVELVGEERGEKVHRIYDLAYTPEKKIALVTSVTASIVSQMMARGDIKVKGVIGPEACVDTDQFLAELAKRKIFVEETVTRTRILG